MTVEEYAGDAQRAQRVPATAFARPALLERLISWPDVTVVHGPIGSGKTTLLAAWVAAQSAPVFWYECQTGHLPFTALEAFARAGAGIVVIDQGERIDADEFARLGRLIDHSPQLRVAIASRSWATASVLAARCDSAVDRIGPEDLAITLEELRDANLLDNDAARLELLHQSEGFAAAVRAKLDDSVLGGTGGRERLRFRLHTGLREQTGRYETALRIALLPRVDRAILVAWGLPEDLLTDLNTAGFANWDGEWLRMHPYNRRLLHEDAQQELPVSEQHRLITIAVRASLIDRDPLQALRLAFDIDDLTLATEVVLAQMIELAEMREVAYDVFRAVPAAKLREHPVLIVMLIVLSYSQVSTRPRAVQLLATESILQRLHPQQGSHRDRVVYRAFEASLVRVTPFSSRALPMTRRAVEEFEALPEADVAALGRMGAFLQVHLGIGALYLGDTVLARRCFELVDAKHVEAGSADRVDPLSLRAGLAALSGEVPLARRLLAEADAIEWPSGWRESSTADFFNLGMAVVALEDGNPNAAERHLTDAGPIEDILEHWQIYALVRALRDRIAGEAEVGLMRLRRLREQRSSAPGTVMAKSLLDAAEAHLLLAVGEPGAARRIATRSVKHSRTCRIALAHAEMALGRPAAAAVHAQQVLSESTRAPSPPTPRNRLDAELVLACVALRTENDTDARVIATRIAELLRSTGVRVPLRTIATADQAPLAKLLLDAGVEQSIVDLIGHGAAGAQADVLQVVTLTPREQVVLRALVETGSLDEIAEQLFVSRNTVKSQVNSLYKKLGVSSRTAALTRAAVLDLIH